MADLTPETLRHDAVALEIDADELWALTRSESSVTERLRYIAALLRGLAKAHEMQKHNALADHRADKWSIGPYGEIFFSRINGVHPSPAAALIALGKEYKND